jgi:hypothetical protein
LNVVGSAPRAIPASGFEAGRAIRAIRPRPFDRFANFFVGAGA